MRKVVVISIVFMLMLGAMIGEIVYVNKFYNSVQSDLRAISRSIERNSANVSNDETVALCERLEKKWEGGKRVLLTLQNHNTVRNFDDKIVSLLAVVRSDNYNDAVIFVRMRSSWSSRSFRSSTL